MPRPKQGPLPNQLVCLFAGSLVISVEAVIVEQPTVGGGVGRILLEGLVQFTGDQLLASLEEVNQREDGMGAATVRVIMQRLPDFAFRLVKQARIVRPAVQNSGDLKKGKLRPRGGKFGIQLPGRARSSAAPGPDWRCRHPQIEARVRSIHSPPSSETLGSRR